MASKFIIVAIQEPSRPVAAQGAIRVGGFVNEEELGLAGIELIDTDLIGVKITSESLVTDGKVSGNSSQGNALYNPIGPLRPQHTISTHPTDSAEDPLQSLSSPLP
ncbi:hypothetical protein M408DRAFT_29379 [Serendipita vermifera MAFF 305830]|uniref:Uncharacterized protein n=1 Tax=Serendipita vermifera MAFF 305830 TaxID=933852 RepID=A0A0C3AAM9_SERVB|nr:hypothetical protein M408DRAFT_29379 [Serendipita vermifera MAFF 305830]